MSLLNPYITFNNNCEEAMNFYKTALGAELSLTTVGQMGGPDVPEDAKNKIMHSTLSLDGETLFFGSDLFSDNFTIGNAINMCLNCTSEEQTHRFFNNLLKDAQSNRELKVEAWGDTYGEIVDKYGIRWLFNYHAA